MAPAPTRAAPRGAALLLCALLAAAAAAPAAAQTVSCVSTDGTNTATCTMSTGKVYLISKTTSKTFNTAEADLVTTPCQHSPLLGAVNQGGEFGPLFAYAVEGNDAFYRYSDLVPTPTTGGADTPKDTQLRIWALATELIPCTAVPTVPVADGAWPATCAGTSDGGDCVADCDATFTGTPTLTCTGGFWDTTASGACTAGGGSDPHLIGFNGAAYEFCGSELPQCKGNAFSIVSAEKLQVNAEVDRLAGADAWPAAGTWVTGLGLRAGAAMTVALRMVKDADFTVVPDGDKTRALPPKGAAGLRALVASAEINGRNMLGMIGSGDTMEIDAKHAVHFPAATHKGDATDGPVMVIETPDSTWTWYLESEDTWHLDFKVALKAGNTINAMHDLLGQSLHWTPTTKAAVEGGDDLAYIVADGLLGTDFKYSLFGKRATTPTRRALLRLPGTSLPAAGTPAALAASD
ncbi:MAG: hypothetical protein J3K34DRAFT_502887 [Monoraphidium minutum]|nr:MAG: hypothetical protein J3K34DRAFT_502887 [Monoraphidium minutum]